MSTAVITGSAGLVGGEAVEYFSPRFKKIIGIDNGERRRYFGRAASTEPHLRQLKRNVRNYEHHSVDIRDRKKIEKIFSSARGIRLVVHAAAQPSHDWAAKDPQADFSVNAQGTLNLLEAARHFSPKTVFIFVSTNKVYGDTPNALPLLERATRWELPARHPYAARGIDESMSIDRSKHSLFGVSKLAADLLVQEYGRYFGMKTGIFRCGCITGPAHAGVEQHGFLSYLMGCAASGKTYTIYGYKGKQVRDNLHARDLVRMFGRFYQKPRPGEVYNAGGGRERSVSVIEAARLCEKIAGRKLRSRYSPQARKGDHMWWITDASKFKKHYPGWKPGISTEAILKEIYDGRR